MSAITFPNSPSAGEQHTINGITYTFTDGTWVAVGQSNFYNLPIASPTVLGGVKSGGTGIQIANDGVISIATGSTFDTNDVDSHLNQSNPTSGYVLSWNGTDYAWVEQSATSTTPFTSISTDTSSSHTLLASDMWKVVKLTSPGGGANLQLTIPDLSASLNFGDEVRILNGANESINVNASATTLYRGYGTTYQTGNRSINGYSLVTLTYIDNNKWNIHGDGIT